MNTMDIAVRLANRTAKKDAESRYDREDILSVVHEAMPELASLDEDDLADIESAVVEEYKDAWERAIELLPPV